MSCSVNVEVSSKQREQLVWAWRHKQEIIVLKSWGRPLEIDVISVRFLRSRKHAQTCGHRRPYLCRSPEQQLAPIDMFSEFAATASSDPARARDMEAI